jgi:vanillate O-demethylase monooxygenase subunit
VQREQERTGVREHIRLGIDNAPARIRRMVDRMREKETGLMATPAASNS